MILKHRPWMHLTILDGTFLVVPDSNLDSLHAG